MPCLPLPPQGRLQPPLLRLLLPLATHDVRVNEKVGEEREKHGALQHQ